MNPNAQRATPESCLPLLPGTRQPDFCTTRLAASGGLRANRLLATLPAEWQRLQPQLQLVQLVHGQVLVDACSVPSHVYFPTTATVSLMSSTRAGGSAELALVGSEGMIGLPVVMGGGSTPSEAVVKTSGGAVRMSRQAVKEEFDRGGPVMQLLLRYAQAFMTHIAQTATCNCHHTVVQRLSRCLLDNLDRSPADEMLMTHEAIALWLGVRRESVTLGALRLQHDGVIESGRGRVKVLSRPALEARSCECYAVVRNEYLRLLPDGEAASWAAPPAARVELASAASGLHQRRGVAPRQPRCAAPVGIS
jgi:CRP-like cAMP-binding protein